MTPLNVPKGTPKELNKKFELNKTSLWWSSIKGFCQTKLTLIRALGKHKDKYVLMIINPEMLLKSFQ